MERRKFLRKSIIGAIAAAVLPVLVVPQVKKRLFEVEWGEPVPIEGTNYQAYTISMKLSFDKDRLPGFEEYLRKASTSSCSGTS